MNQNPEKYLLSASQHESIFQTQIKPLVFESIRKTLKPTAVILGWQPWSGKSALITHVNEDMKTLGGVAHIIGDNFRGYHPAYAPLMRQDDKMAAFYTDRDTGRWVEKAIAHAICERVNIIIEGTMRDSTKVEETMKNLRQAGYQVDARVLVVKSELSWQGIIQR